VKILIIANWYPPDLRVPARRWGNLVAYLQKAGHHCTVISAGDGNQNSYIGNAGENIIRVGISNRDIEKEKPEIAVKAKKSIKQQLKGCILRTIPSSWLSKPKNSWLRVLQNTPDILQIAQQSDFIISSYGPMGTFMAGNWLAQTFNKKWVADIRDAFESKGSGKFWLAGKLDRFYEKQMLKKAFLKITVGETLANYLSKQYNQEFIAIYNGWSIQDMQSSRYLNNTDNPYLYYAGTIYQHQIPALNVLFKALLHFPQLQLKVRLLKDSTGGDLKDLAEKSNQSRQIVFLPPAPPELIEEELMQSSGAIVIESIDSSDELRNGTVTGKLLSLLVSGLPGIAVVSEKCEITKLVQKATGWYSVDNVDDCIVSIIKILEEQKLIDNSEVLKEFNMEQQAAKLIKELRNRN
jgi:glycosyltransferase involved in cell wall biosynthesis